MFVAAVGGIHAHNDFSSLVPFFFSFGKRTVVSGDMQKREVKGYLPYGWVGREYAQGGYDCKRDAIHPILARKPQYTFRLLMCVCLVGGREVT